MNLFAKEEMIEHQVKLEEFYFLGPIIVFRDSISEIKGYADVDYDKDNNILSVHEIEMIEKGKGFGEKAITSLLELYKNVKIIRGISLEDSISFWSKFDNVEFFETCRDCDLHETEDCPLFFKGEVCDEYSENNFKMTVK